MNRIVVHLKSGDLLGLYADEPVQFFVVDEGAPDDRVYEYRLGEFGAQEVQKILRNEPVGHALDSHPLGEGYGPRKPPSRPPLRVVK